MNKAPFHLLPVLALAFFLSGAPLAAADDQVSSGGTTSNAQPAPDPAVWGMFSRLMGGRWSYDAPDNNGDSRYRTCSWSVPGRTILVQEFKDGKPYSSFTITRTAISSEFDITYVFGSRSSTRKAHLQSDGSYLLLHDGFMKPPTHMLIKDGRWEEDNVSLDSSGVVRKVNWSNTFSDQSPPHNPLVGPAGTDVASTVHTPSKPIIVSVPEEPVASIGSGPTKPHGFDVSLPPQAIILGKSVSGHIAPGASGHGCYQVDVPEGQTLAIRLSSSAFAPILQVARGALCQGVVPQKEASGHVGKPSELVFETEGGRYLILVKAASAKARGTYSLNVELRSAIVTTGNADEAVAADSQPRSDSPDVGSTSATPASTGAQEPRVALMLAQVASRHAELAAEEVQRQEEARQRLLAEERQREQERLDRQQAAANRQANFDAFMGGLQTVTTALQESNDAAEQQRQQAYAAAKEQREQQNRQMQAEQAAQAVAQQRQQAAGREAAARQMVAANAYRSQQMAKTTDTATLQRLQADNQQALLVARQIGMGQRVAAGTAMASQPAADAQARNRADQQRLAQQQAEQQTLAQQQAEQQREGERKAAEQRREQAQARDRQQQAEQQRIAREQAANQKQALANHLMAERNGIHLRALTCPGGNGSYFVAGTRPRISPQVANCISVQYEARCAGVPRGNGVQGTAYNFVGGDSCLGDTTTIPAQSCAADQVIVEVRLVTTCQ